MKSFLLKNSVEFIDKEFTAVGWVFSRRDHGKLIFIDLKDRSGILQVVFSPQNTKNYEDAKQLRDAWVIEVRGKITKRPENLINKEILTGGIELQASEFKIINSAEGLPIEITSSGKDINEESRLKYRYLDLRRPRLTQNISKRHESILFIRNWFNKKDFIEIETPILSKSTPEGARDYLVPSRIEPGKFYALPQSPQQYKQMLMVAGFERYFQIARCFRDEDSRGDRQPEFTQIDVEMSFIQQEDILKLTEELMVDLVKNVWPEKKIAKTPFPRLTYKEARERYKIDRPDLREVKSQKSKVKNDNELAFCFVVDFPLFEWREKEKRWDATHHPFTKPKLIDSKEELNKKFKENPAEILAEQYDLVLNGEEIAGGSLRIYQSELLEAVFEILGHKKQDISNKFGHLLEAFKYGVPPHGGIAFGLDRLFMVLFNENSIRETIAFPKLGNGKDPLMDSPSEVDKEQLDELGIKIHPVK